MKITATIPDQIYKDITAGHGRIKLQKNHDLSPKTARFFLNLHDEALNSGKWRVMLALFDAHVPYHSEEALSVALEEGGAHKPDTVTLGGDWSDNYKVSRWKKDPRRMSFVEEVAIVKEKLKQVELSTPDAKERYYLFGNHEDRFIDFINSKTPELCELEGLEFKNVYGLDDGGWILKDNITLLDEGKLPFSAGRLTILHGHEIRLFMSSKNPAENLFQKVYGPTIIGHVHKRSSFTPNAINGEIQYCYTVGCLCHLHERYLPVNQWTWGWAIIRWNDVTSQFLVENMMYKDGRVI